MSRLQDIKVSQIEKTQNALREVIEDKEGFQELLASVRSRGVMSPITVRTTDDPELFELVDGRHRLTAAIEAGLTEIPCQVYENMDDSEQLQAQLVANACKVETKPGEYSKQIKRVLEINPTMTHPELAGKLGKSTNWISKMLRIEKLPDAVLAAIDDGSICLANAIDLANLPEEEQESWIERAISQPSGEFGPAANARARQIRQDKLAGKEKTEEVFTPRPKVRKGASILEELTSKIAIANLCKKGAEQDGARKILDWICGMDEETLVAARETWEAAKKQRDETKARKAKERLEKESKKNADRNAEIAEQMASSEG